MGSPRVWLVTGSSTGIGFEMTKLALKKGDIVVATARKPKVLDDLKAEYPSSQLITLQLDVSDPQHVKDAFKQAKASFGRVDVVFSNAGYGVLGEVEATPEDEARAMFDTNFWGAATVGREAVRFFREENTPSGGHLINVTSQAGVHAWPALGYYAASKHALEGLMGSFAAELDPDWNIKITNAELGGFDTPGVYKVGSGHAHPAYTKPTLPTVAIRAAIASRGPDPTPIGADASKAVQRLYDLSLLPDPPVQFPLGKDAIGVFRAQSGKLEQAAAKFESWSEGLEFDK